MPKLRDTWNSCVGVVLLLLAVTWTFFTTFILLPVAWDTLAHEYHRRSMELELILTQHPEHTSFVSSRSAVGLYAGNSNHCDYFAGQLRSFSGDRQAIIDFYRAKNIHILFVENQMVGFKEFFNQPADWGITSEKLQGDFYIAYKTDYFNPPGEDIRCH